LNNINNINNNNNNNSNLNNNNESSNIENKNIDTNNEKLTSNSHFNHSQISISNEEKKEMIKKDQQKKLNSFQNINNINVNNNSNINMNYGSMIEQKRKIIDWNKQQFNGANIDFDIYTQNYGIQKVNMNSEVNSNSNIKHTNIIEPKDLGALNKI
jgi:hypothetical protein